MINYILLFSPSVRFSHTKIRVNRFVFGKISHFVNYNCVGGHLERQRKRFGVSNYDFLHGYLGDDAIREATLSKFWRDPLRKLF